MYEYHISHFITKEREIIYGYDFEDACRRAKLNPDVYNIDDMIYVD